MMICPVCSTEYSDDVKFCPNDGQTLRSAAPANDLVGQVIADRYHVVSEPAKLAEARPDLSFPPGLQPVLDTALAHTPMDRYQTVAKFAADIAAVTRRPAVGAVPATQEKTQLLDATAGAATRDSALKFYAAPGISVKDKACAAFVVGQAYFNLGKRPTGCGYIRTANQLDPETNTYSALTGQCQD